MRPKSRFGIILGQEPHFPVQGRANQRRARALSPGRDRRRSRVSQLPPVGRAFLLLPRLRVRPSQLPYPLRSFLHVASPAALSLLLGRSTVNIRRAVAVSPPSPIPLLCSALPSPPSIPPPPGTVAKQPLNLPLKQSTAPNLHAAHGLVTCASPRRYFCSAPVPLLQP